MQEQDNKSEVGSISTALSLTNLNDNGDTILDKLLPQEAKEIFRSGVEKYVNAINELFHHCKKNHGREACIDLHSFISRMLKKKISPSEAKAMGDKYHLVDHLENLLIKYNSMCTGDILILKEEPIYQYTNHYLANSGLNEVTIYETTQNIIVKAFQGLLEDIKESVYSEGKIGHYYQYKNGAIGRVQVMNFSESVKENRDNVLAAMKTVTIRGDTMDKLVLQSNANKLVDSMSYYVVMTKGILSLCKENYGRKACEEAFEILSKATTENISENEAKAVGDKYQIMNKGLCKAILGVNDICIAKDISILEKQPIYTAAYDTLSHAELTKEMLYSSVQQASRTMFQNCLESAKAGVYSDGPVDPKWKFVDTPLGR